MVNNTRMEKWANTLNVPFKSATREEKSSLFGAKTTVSGGQPGEKDQPPMVMGQGEGIEGQGTSWDYSFLQKTFIASFFKDLS